MFLIGQYDSPFVRRTAIAMRLYGIDFQHRPWSTFGDAEKIAAHNPLRRVPTLVLDSGEALIESFIILDYLDELVGEARAMISPHGTERRRHLRLCALATGLGDKSVSLVYESVLRKEQLQLVERCEAQITGSLDVLERERADVKRRISSASASAIPTSRSPACSALPAKRIRISTAPHAIRHWRNTRPPAKPCRRFVRLCSRSLHQRANGTAVRIITIISRPFSLLRRG